MLGSSVDSNSPWLPESHLVLVVIYGRKSVGTLLIVDNSRNLLYQQQLHLIQQEQEQEADDNSLQELWQRWKFRNSIHHLGLEQDTASMTPVK